MSVMKVILAALVIFGLGVVTGGLVDRRIQTPTAVSKPEEAPRPPHFGKSDQARRFDFLKCARKELDLTPEQQAQVELVVSNGQKRVRAIWDEFNPRMQAHYCETRDQINGILTPEQRERFEELLKRHRSMKSEEGRDRDGRRDGPPGDRDEPPPNP